MPSSYGKTIFEILGRNPIHPFPARMAPGIALEALGEPDRPLLVLDPMAGSGTVLAVARANGHRAVGFDLDPLAVLLAGVWTRTVDSVRVTDKAKEVLDRAKSNFRTLRVGNAYPHGADNQTKQFIRYWFDDYARRQLASLSSSISGVHDDVTRDALWCGFSRLIITKSAGASRARDLSHSRPHLSFERSQIKPFRKFLAGVDTVVSNCPRRDGNPVGPVAAVKYGDARDMQIDDSSIDLVLTSPPYLNGIDYIRCSKFSLVWMGHTVGELGKIRGSSVGAEASQQEALDAPWVKSLVKQLNLKPALSDRNEALLARYVWDMGKAIAEVSRVLKQGARAVYVIGDSTTRGTFIPNSRIIAAIAESHGLVETERHSRGLPANRRYLPPPQRNGSEAALDGRLRREVVVTFTKH